MLNNVNPTNHRTAKSLWNEPELCLRKPERTKWMNVWLSSNRKNKNMIQSINRTNKGLTGIWIATAAFTILRSIRNQNEWMSGSRTKRNIGNTLISIQYSANQRSIGFERNMTVSTILRLIRSQNGERLALEPKVNWKHNQNSYEVNDSKNHSYMNGIRRCQRSFDWAVMKQLKVWLPNQFDESRKASYTRYRKLSLHFFSQF